MQAAFVSLSSIPPPRPVRRRRESYLAVWLRLIFLWPLVCIWVGFAADSVWQWHIFKTGTIAQAIIKSSRILGRGQGRKWGRIGYQVGSDATVHETDTEPNIVALFPVASSLPVRMGRHLLGAPLVMPIINSRPSHEFYDQFWGLGFGGLLLLNYLYYNVIEHRLTRRLIIRGFATQGTITRLTRVRGNEWLHYEWKDNKEQPRQSKQTVDISVMTPFQEGQAVQILFYPGTNRSTVYELAEYEVAP